MATFSSDNCKGGNDRIVRNTVRFIVDLTTDSSGDPVVSWGTMSGASGTTYIKTSTISHSVDSQLAKLVDSGEGIDITIKIKKGGGGLSIVTPGTDPAGP